MSAIDRMPPQSILEPHQQDADFERRYAIEVARKFDRLALPGISVTSTSRPYPLTAAYVSLQAVAKASDGTMRAEDIEVSLARGDRFLVRGEAGHGKSTLLGWLAVNAARKSFENPLKAWNNRVPFLIRLRHVHDELPSPDLLASTIVPLIASYMPLGWTHRILESGRALILLDGVDEIPEAMQPALYEWVESLLAAFPRTAIVCTSRPAAVPAAWLSAVGFGPLEIQPMSLEDVDRCIRYWHRAAAYNLGEADKEHIFSFAVPLELSLRSVPHLRQLARTPLLCAWLCALHLERGHIPHNRLELYSTAVSLMLDRRNLQNLPTTSRESSLSIENRKVLLRDLSYWMMLNGLSEVDSALATQVIERSLREIPGQHAAAREVLADLILTSGLLRESVPGTIEFIHRSFQEFLCAGACAQEDSIGFLIGKAGQDDWRETIILVAGQCIDSQRERLLKGLLAFDGGGRRSALLSAACLETSPRVPRPLLEKISNALASVIPPRNAEDIAALASAGDLAVRQLLWHANMSHEDAQRNIRVLCRIATELAQEALVSYTVDKRSAVQQELVDSWPFFERTEFASSVLSYVEFANETISLVDPSLLRYIDAMPNVRVARGEFNRSDPQALKAVGQVSKLRLLDFSRNRYLQSLRDINSQPSVTHLYFRDCSSLRWSEGVGHFPEAISLDLGGCDNLEEIYGLAGSFPKLEKLKLSGCRKLSTLNTMNQFASTLRELDIRGVGFNLWQPLRGLQKLEHLVVSSQAELDGVASTLRTSVRISVRPL
jgi:hypothetical protein